MKKIPKRSFREELARKDHLNRVRLSGLGEAELKVLDICDRILSRLDKLGQENRKGDEPRHKSQP